MVKLQLIAISKNHWKSATIKEMVSHSFWEDDKPLLTHRFHGTGIFPYLYHKKSAIHVGRYYHKIMVTLGNQPIQKMVASWTFRVDGLHWVKVWILGCLFECIDLFVFGEVVFGEMLFHFFGGDHLSFGVSILLDGNYFHSSSDLRFINNAEWII